MDDSHDPLDGVPIVGDAVHDVEGAIGDVVQAVESWLVPDLDIPVPPAAGGEGDVADAPTSGSADVAMPMPALDPGTQGALDFAQALNAQSAPVVEAIHTLESGGDLSEEQMARLARMSASAHSWSNALGILNQADAIHNDAISDMRHQQNEEAAWQAVTDADVEKIHADGVISDAEKALKKAEDATGVRTY